MGPTISVIVPIYNVEPYLRPCLNSLARQSYSRLQVVLVDDGSTDGSVGIAEEVAAADERFSLVRQPNRGLGAARNTGIDHATGEFLAFVDSDDLLPREALSLLHASLDASGSDLAAGVVRRFGPSGTYRSRLTPYRRTVRRTHIRVDDDLLMDSIVTNKLWRRSFWDGQHLRFPEGVLYEDVRIAFTAQTAADAVDILHDTVYWWRQRGESITQRRAAPEGIRDRTAAVLAVGAFMAERGMPDLHRRYQRVVLARELRQFIDVADLGSEEYRQALVAHVKQYLDHVGDEVLDQLPAIQRLKYHLTGRGLIDELLEVLTFEWSDLRDAPTHGQGEQRFAVYPYFDDPRLQIPRDVYRLRTELEARCAVHRARWAGRKLKLRGYAYIDHVDAPAPGSVTTTLVVRHRETGRETEVATRSGRDRGATLRADQGAHRYDGAGFRATVDLRMLGIPDDGEATFDVEAVVRADGIERRGVAWQRTRSSVERVGRAALDDGRTVRTSFKDDRFVIRIERAPVVVTRLKTLPDALALRGSLPGSMADPETLYVRRRPGARPYRPPVKLLESSSPDGREFRTKLMLEKLRDRAEDRAAGHEPRDDEHDTDVPWHVRLRLDDGTDAPMLVRASVPTTGLVADDREFTLHRTRHGNLSLTERRLRPVVTTAKWHRATVVLSAQQAVEEHHHEIVLRRRGTGEERVLPAQVDGPQVEIVLPLAAMPDAGAARPLPEGTWDLLVETGDQAMRVPLRAHVDAIDRLESARVNGGRRYALRDVNYGRMAVEVSHVPARSRWQELHDQRRAATFARRPARDGLVVFISWHGRRYAGDVRAISEAIRGQRGIKSLWVGDDAQLDADDIDLVERGTRRHVEALSRAGVIVTDHLLPSWWRPAPGQRVVQTWHGTPVRRSGADLPDHMARAARRHLAELQRQAATWSVLVAPSPAAAEVLRRATGYDGVVLEAGAPRSDIHHRADERSARARSVRRRLGIDDSSKVVLWAPTARDDGSTGRRKLELGVDLHLDQAADLVGGDVVFLTHRHPAVNRAPTNLSGRLHDVTGVHDVADLLVVADVLVSDYSSVVLDHLHTAKPLVLFMPDLDEFTGQGPGFAVDLTRDPPGRLATNSGEALAAVAEALGGDSSATGYDRLLADYGGPRDGRAAQRVAEHILDR